MQASADGCGVRCTAGVVYAAQRNAHACPYSAAQERQRELERQQAEQEREAAERSARRAAARAHGGHAVAHLDEESTRMLRQLPARRASLAGAGRGGGYRGAAGGAHSKPRAPDAAGGHGGAAAAAYRPWLDVQEGE